MANFKRIPVMVDAATGKQIDEFGSVVRDNDFFRLLFDETVVLCCQFYDVSWIDGEAQLTEHSIDPDLTLSAFGDNEFDYLTSFMFLSEQTEDENNMVNIASDWFDGATANPANGQLSFRINTNTTRFAEALNSSGLQNFYFCITGIPSGQTDKSVLAYFRFKAENRPSSSVGAPVSGDPEYLNSQEVQALVKSAPIFQFSIDGATDWHDTQVAADRYYREQRNGGEWSEAIALIKPTDAFVYVAYASDNSGADFNTTPSDALKYRAEIHVSEEIGTPSASDFSASIWVKYLGDTGAQGEQGIQGEAGIDAFVYVAYASDDSGTNWNLTPSVSLKYRAEIHSITALTPVESDFSGTTWVKYLGENGTGVAPQGTYNSSTTYTLNDGVTYNGSYYRSLVLTNLGHQPDTSTGYWQEMVAKGDTGEQGEQGEQGIQGEQGATGTNILTAISGFSYLFPDPDFTDYANSANIESNRGDYGADAALVSTSSNEPVGYPLCKIPADTASLKFREVFEPENGYGWNGETVIFKGEFKKMANNITWSSVTAVDIGTFTAPSAETPTGDTTLDSAVISNMSDTSGLAAGMIISGSGIPSGATIASVDSSTQITISDNATATASTVSFTCKSTAPQLYEVTVSLATLGLAVGDVVNFVQRIDSSSTYTNDIALEFAEIEVITS